MSNNRNILHKIEQGTDPQTVHCTTYQMRNPYQQFYDACATELDAHCYFQHAAAADLCPKGGAVLDVCCGRGLLIPMLRYRAKPQPSLYAGVDIHPANAKWSRGADPRREAQQRPDGWGFPVVFAESDVATMAEPVRRAVLNVVPDFSGFDLVVYTSAIEHMQPAAQQASLVQARKVSKAGAVMYLSCPVTHPDPSRTGYDTQYAAHVYEPTLDELRSWLAFSGWRIDRYVGLCSKAGTFRKMLVGDQLAYAERIYADQPREQALCTIGYIFPQVAEEMAIYCTAV